jgi:hypothetical protein
MAMIHHENLRIHLVVRDNFRDLQKTLASLCQAATALSGAKDESGRIQISWLKIFVFDDGSKPRIADQIKKYCEKEMLIWAERTLLHSRSAFSKGYAEAHNVLLKESEADSGFLMILQSGIEVDKDFFIQLQDEVLPLSSTKARCFIPTVKYQGKTMAGGAIVSLSCTFKARKYGPASKEMFLVGLDFVVPYQIFSKTLGFDSKMPESCVSLELSWRMNEAQWNWQLIPMLCLSYPRKYKVLKDAKYYRARLLLAKRHLSGWKQKLALLRIYLGCGYRSIFWLTFGSRPDKAVDLLKDVLTERPL